MLTYFGLDCTLYRANILVQAGGRKQEGAALRASPSDASALPARISAAFAGTSLHLEPPNGLMTLHHDNVTLLMPSAIAWYLAPTTLKPQDPIARAQVLQWIDYSKTEISPVVSNWLKRESPDVVKRAKLTLNALLRVLDATLLPRTFLVAERMSLADITVYSALLPAFQSLLDPPARKRFVNLNRWFQTIRNQPAVDKVVGPYELCVKEAQTGEKPKK